MNHKTHDPVNHPSHYTQGGIECIDAIEAALTPEEFIGFLKGQVFKYTWRLGHKDRASQDQAKALWYGNRLREFLEKQESPFAPVKESGFDKQQIVKMAVDRFLGWELPKTFSPDCHIEFTGRTPDGAGNPKTWPVGTNLFTAEEARQMFEHCLPNGKRP
jgi:hypothetical protein